LKPSANGVAIFACYGAGEFFEALQLSVPIEDHLLYVYNQPHLYHLARLEDAFPQYAAVLTDTNFARIFTFGLGETIGTSEVTGKKMNRSRAGGSQARYQRRVDNANQDHIKEVAETLERIVREEKIEYVILSGDPVALPILQQHLPKTVSDKVVDILRLDNKTSEQELLEATLEAMKEQDAKTDAEKVERLFSAYRGRGLAVIGRDEVLEALANSQVEEMLISASLERDHSEPEEVEAILAPEIPDSGGGTDSDEPRPALLPDLLVTKAKQTNAQVTFIEDPALLEGVGGVAAFLRWRK